MQPIKRLSTYVFLLAIIGSSPYLSAQQNFFNVPSYEITKKNKIFIQEQLNINQITQSNLTIDYGLGHNFQIGINVIGIDLYHSKKLFANNSSTVNDFFEPLFLVNAQKTFEIGKHFNTSIGSNQGVNLDVASSKLKYAQFDYLVTGSKLFNDRMIMVLGGYYGNNDYFEQSSSFGVLAGTDINIYKNKIHLVGDWISGTTPASVGVYGFSYFVTPKFPISIGWQVPNTKSNASAIVIEFTWNPSIVK